MPEETELKSGTLPSAVAAKYSVKPGCAIAPYRWNNQDIDLRVVSVEQADELVKNGFDVLVLKPSEPKTAEKK